MIADKMLGTLGLVRKERLEGLLSHFQSKILEMDYASAVFSNEMKMDRAIMIERDFDENEIHTCLDWYQREIEKREFASNIINEIVKNSNQ
jgi:hypothetical protein